MLYERRSWPGILGFSDFSIFIVWPSAFSRRKQGKKRRYTVARHFFRINYAAAVDFRAINQQSCWDPLKSSIVNEVKIEGNMPYKRRAMHVATVRVIPYGDGFWLILAN